MIRAEQIPPEVVEAAASDIVQTLHLIAAENGMTMTGAEEAMDGFREVARAAIAAALNAWPGKKHVTEYYLCVGDHFEPAIILPLPLEEGRSCTCHPSEAPTPCQRKYALGDCIKAALEGK